MGAETEESVNKVTEEVVVDKVNEDGSNAEVGVDFSCDLCDSKVSSLRAVRIHEGKKHKVTGSPLPQVDGVHDEEVLYTFVSDFHKDDIEYTMDELFPAKNTQLVSCIAHSPMQCRCRLHCGYQKNYF